MGGGVRDREGGAGAREGEGGGHAQKAEKGKANEAVLALISLGYKQVEAHKAVRDVQQANKETSSAEDLVRLTLQRLASGK